MSDKKKMKGSVMIVGGGIGGMQAALDLADSQFKVYVVEKESTIGGTMAKLDKTFPTGDCAMCMISPKMVEVGRHPNIVVKSMSQVTGVSGEPGDYKVKLLEKARFVDTSKCTGCGVCTMVCPVRNVIQIPEKAPLPKISPEDKQKLESILHERGAVRSSMIAILQDINTQFRHLPRAVLAHLGNELNTPLSEILRVATFYSQFKFNPPGEHEIKICVGTACHVRGSGLIIDAVVRKLGIRAGETTKDMKFSLEKVACFGSCALAPVVVVGEKVYGGMTPAKMEKLIGDLS